jgi:signal transduction histidine kinase/CheY-like chemotaxis protein
MTNGRKAGQLTEGQAAVRRLIALGAALVAIVIVGGVALLFAGSHALNLLQAREDRALATNALARTEQQLVRDLTTVTVWDQAVRELRPGGSVKWQDEEIGSYLNINRGHDIIVALDGQDAAFYAWTKGERVDPASQRAFVAAAAPLLRAARTREAARGDRAPNLAPTDPELSETAAGVVRFAGVDYLVGVSTVTPENAATARAPGPASVVISAQRVDGSLAPILTQMGLKDVRPDGRFAGSPDAIPLRNVNGQAAGQVSWRPDRPGWDALISAAPALAAAALVVTLLMGALAWHIARVARRLEMHEQAHDQALADLKEARDRAESANVAKSLFLANMSHEIRTPLNGVLGMAQVLARSDLASADQEKLKVIRASGEALLGLLNDLLDLSKIEAGRMEIDVHDFDLEEAVATATRSFATLAGQKDVRFLVAVEPDARGVWRGDGGKIRQVVANLASNAVKFTSAGEIRVLVRGMPGGIACTVSDSGAGIARDRLGQLFERFSQVDPTATRRFGGTGLGLAICRELVELMGGKVSVTSVEGRGSAFSFELPLEWVGLPAAAAPADEADHELPALRVLAAEDNKTNQLLLTAMLEPLGAKLRLTSDGAEALAAFTAERFDVVLMDVQMPMMNGVDAARAMRAMEAERGLAPTPILALSANVMRHQIEEYLAAGMNGFVAKPIEMAALIAAIEQAVAPEASESAAA